MNKMKKIIYLLVLVILTSNTIKAQNEIKITNFNVYTKDSKLIIDWATDGNVATNYWQVQHSPDGVQFTTIAYVLGPDPKQSGDHYEYVEKVKAKKPVYKYYRLMHIDSDGIVMTSEIKSTAK